MHWLPFILLSAATVIVAGKKPQQEFNAPAGQKVEYVLQDSCIEKVEIGDCRGPGPRDLRCGKLVITLKEGKKLEDCEDINVYRQPAEKIPAPQQ